MIIMRKYQQELPEGCSAERVFFFFFFPHFFYAGLLHRSHSPRQFACLSESEKGGLSALMPHRGCALCPNRPLLAFKSESLHLPFLFYLAPIPLTITPHPSFPVITLASLGRERGRKPGLLFNEIRKPQVAVFCHKPLRGLVSRWGAFAEILPHRPLLLSIYIDSLSVDTSALI